MYILWENNKVSSHVGISATFNLDKLEMWGMVHGFIALNNLPRKICHICKNKLWLVQQGI